jgi:RNA polymerase sigma-70 factor (ECF subfamily)
VSTVAARDFDSEQLLDRAGAGDSAARQELLVKYRQRLRQMIAVRMDPRLAARIDPSDVVQETLAVAVRQLSEYVQHPPLPFYPWLRQLAWKRLADLHRQHIQAGKRSVRREQHWTPPLPEESALDLANRLLHRGSSPSARLRREEVRSRVRDALARLPRGDREVLVLRQLEQLSTPEIAAVLGITEGAVYTRHLRALDRLRNLLGDDFLEDGP